MENAGAVDVNKDDEETIGRPTRPTLGKLVAGLRARNGWTLRQMSALCGIPVSTLSKVEHDRLTLTYDKLQQLAEGASIDISQLFSEPAENSSDRVTARRSVARMANALRVTTENYDYYYLCTELRRKRMVPMVTRITARTREEFGPLMVHEGEEYVHVLDGQIVVHTEFYDPVELGKGEGIYLDSNMGHAYLAAEECSEAFILAVCSSAETNLFQSLLASHELRASKLPHGQASMRPASPLAE